MRCLFLVLTILTIAAVPVHAAKPIKNDGSPELKQCVKECQKEKDATARESCDVQCVQADKERKKSSDAATGGQ